MGGRGTVVSRVGGCGWAVAIAIAAPCFAFRPAAASVISEILTGPAGPMPAYVELDLADRAGPVELLILDARPGSERIILQALALEATGADFIVLHDGPWPDSLRGAGDVLIQPADLRFTGRGAARRFALFDHHNHFGAKAPPPENWTGVLDVVTCSINHWPVEALPGETPLPLAAGDAVMRDPLAIPHDYRHTHTTGPVDADLRFVDHPGIQLTPAAPNAGHVPEPATVLLILSGALARVRRPLRSPCRRGEPVA